MYIHESTFEVKKNNKKFMKDVLKQERVLGFRTTLMKGFDPLQMLTSV